MNPPADWYPDPDRPKKRLRYWDGEEWTSHTTARRGERVQRPAPDLSKTKKGAIPSKSHVPVLERNEQRDHLPEEAYFIPPDPQPRSLPPLPKKEIPAPMVGMLYLALAVLLVVGGALTYRHLSGGGVEQNPGTVVPVVKGDPLPRALRVLHQSGFDTVTPVTKAGKPVKKKYEKWDACATNAPGLWADPEATLKLLVVPTGSACP